MWRNSDRNAYPDIILHDCFVSDISIEQTALSFLFDEGFWITPRHKQNQSGKVLRSGESQISYPTPDFSSLSVYLFKRNRVTGQTIRKEISVPELSRRIKGRQWKLELVDEFYHCGGAVFFGYVHTGRAPYHIECQIIMGFSEAIYHWNEVQQNREW